MLGNICNFSTTNLMKETFLIWLHGHYYFVLSEENLKKICQNFISKKSPEELKPWAIAMLDIHGHKSLCPFRWSPWVEIFLVTKWQKPPNNQKLNQTNKTNKQNPIFSIEVRSTGGSEEDPKPRQPIPCEPHLLQSCKSAHRTCDEFLLFVFHFLLFSPCFLSNYYVHDHKT